MSKLHFDPIEGRAEEIIQAIMDTPEVKAVPSLDFALHLVVEEIVVNIVSYAYPKGVAGDAIIEVTLDDNDIALTFIDHGTPFDPLAKEDPDVTLGINDRPIGGLGIFLVKNTMDSVEYKYDDGCNVLRMRKKSPTPLTPSPLREGE